MVKAWKYTHGYGYPAGKHINSSSRRNSGNTDLGPPIRQNPSPRGATVEVLQTSYEDNGK